MEMELKLLLESGLKAYYDDPSSFSPKERRQIFKDIRKLLSTTSLEKEPLLQLVLDYYTETINKRKIDKAWEYGDVMAVAQYESKFKYEGVQDFLFGLIKTFHKAQGELYVKQREAYYNDKEVLASIIDFGINPDQFWFLLQFCKYYVFSQTKNLYKRYPSVREDLEMLIDAISKMEFDDSDWDSAYPRFCGELTIKINNKKQHNIINHKALNLLSTIIKEYLNKKHDYDIDYHLNNQDIQESKDLIKYMYCIGNKSKLTEDEKTFCKTYNPWFDKEEEIKYDSIMSRRMALFTYYIEQFLKDKVGHEKSVCVYYPEYNESVGINHDKLFLISKLIYILGDIHNIPKDKRNKLYGENRFLKDCLRGYRIKDQKGVEECLAIIREEGVSNS